MYEIKNNENLEFAWWLLTTLQKQGGNDEAVIKTKRRIRDYNKVQNAKAEAKKHDYFVVDRKAWDIYYHVVKVDRMTEEEKREYEEYNRTVIHSPYDCTGRPFTMGFHFVDVGETTIIIETIGLDV